MARYIYAHKAYETVTKVQEAVTAFKTRLDNNPTDWCGVKPLIDSQVISIPEDNSEPIETAEDTIVKSTSTNIQSVRTYQYGDALSDEEINALGGESEKYYNVFAVHDGSNFTHISEVEVVEKVLQMRTSYAKWRQVDKYYDTQVSEGEDSIEINVSNEDMTKYV